MKEPCATAAELLWNLDAHDAERKKFVNERLGNLCALVHLTAERTDFAVRELIHAVTKQPFVFGQVRQGWLSHARMLTPVLPELCEGGAVRRSLRSGPDLR